MTTPAEQLAKAFAADFGDSASESEEELQQDGSQDNNGEVTSPAAASTPATPSSDTAGDGQVSKKREILETAEEAKARIDQIRMKDVKDVRTVALLIEELRPILEKIRYYEDLPAEELTTDVGIFEDNPEYQLLNESNDQSTKIDAEVMMVHKFIRDHYSTRFPELERLVENPYDYAKAVAMIGNGPMDQIKSIETSRNNIFKQPLRDILDGASLMVVRLEAITTKGVELPEEELERILVACKMVQELGDAKTKMAGYVESRMNIFAPNLSALLGSHAAAQLINYSGGIVALSRTPACNVAAHGANKNKETGFASNVGVHHQGYLFHSPIIQDVPGEFKAQAQRIVSAKLVLAARIDSVHQSPDGSEGSNLRAQCMDRIDNVIEPPPNKASKALKVPEDKPSRKRGGARARKAKEQLAMTDLSKEQNRMAFNEEEKEVGFGDTTKGLGMIGKGSGHIREQQIDRKTRARLSKKSRGWGDAPSGDVTAMGGKQKGASGLRTSGVGVAGQGSSSMAFTPVQGLELVNPKVRADMQRKRKAEDEDKWFVGGTFSKVDSAGFKVPALPNKKVDTGKTKGVEKKV